MTSPSYSFLILTIPGLRDFFPPCRILVNLVTNWDNQAPPTPLRTPLHPLSSKTHAGSHNRLPGVKPQHLPLMPSVPLSHLLRPPPTSMPFIYTNVKLLKKKKSFKKKAVSFAIWKQDVRVVSPDSRLPVPVLFQDSKINPSKKPSKISFFFRDTKKQCLLWLATANMIRLLCKLLFEDLTTLNRRNEDREESQFGNGFH